MSQDTARTLATLRGLTMKFVIAVEAAKPYYPVKSTIFMSGGADEQYGGLGNMPGIREWVGDRIFHSLRSQNFVLANKKWENSIAIEKDDIDDDRLGMYSPVMEQLAVEAAYHPDELLLTAQINGTANACMDGQYFYDTDHSWGDSGTQSNKLTYVAATGTVPTEDEFRLAYEQAQAAIMGFKRDNGKFFYRPTLEPISDFVLEVPTAMQGVATRAILKGLVNGGETNLVINPPAKIVTIPGLTDSASFYLHRVGQPLKPFVFQARKPLATQMKGTDDREFKDVKFMTDARYNVGYLAWWNSVLTTFT